MSRLNVELSDNEERLLDSLMEMSHAKSKTDLVINALLFFSWGLNTAWRGHMVASVNKEKNLVEGLQMPLLHNAAQLGEEERKKQQVLHHAAAD